MQSGFANLSRWQALLLLLIVLAATGYGLYLALAQVTVHTPVYQGKHRLAGADLKYYRIVVDRVRNGENYYDVAREQLPEWGFPIGSPFNWRLPTYAYLLAFLPGSAAIQIVLALIALLGLVLCVAAELKVQAFLPAIGTGLLLIGVATWPLGGEAYYAQEVWAGMLIMLSIGAAGCAAYSPRWRMLAVSAGLLALAFRELVLPYCLVAAMLALWNRRRLEAAAWLCGIILFAGYLAWHVGQVEIRLGASERADGLGIAGWVQFGGLAFDIMATRMNAWVIALPGWAVFLYLVLAIIGLLGWRSEQGGLLTLTTLAYLVTFAIVGRSMNFNWGLMFAPMLPFGVVRAPAMLLSLVKSASQRGTVTEQHAIGSEGINSPSPG